MPFRGAWQPQYVQYNLGDAVEYQGQYYEIIQPHHSQADWAPTVTPALWNHVDKSGYDGHSPQDHPHVYQPAGAPHYDGFAPRPGGGYTTPNGQEVPHDEANKPWYDIRGDTKKELLAAGGLAVGLGLLGGAMYKHHEKHEKDEQEQREAQAWELQNWVINAKKHSDEFIRDGPKGPATWILSDTFLEHPNLMRNLVQGGEEDGQPWFIARAPYNGSLQIGKGRLEQGNEHACIGYNGETIEVKKFELLISAPHATTWVRIHGGFNPSAIQASPVKGGHEKDGPDLYVAHVWYKGAMYPGKCGQSVRGGAFCYNGREIAEEEYEVLCYKQ